MNRKPIVALGLPTFDMVHADFALSLASMIAATRHEVMFGFCHSKATWVAHARNLIVEGAQGIGADWLLWLDSDMTFPKETLLRLLSHDRDIVGATYVKKKPPYDTINKALPKYGETRGQFKNVPANGLYEMIGLPFGVMLMRMSVFDALPKPWFHYRHHEGELKMEGEDYLFCDEIRAKGKQIWLDAALSMYVGHIGTKVYRPKEAYALFDEDSGQRLEDARTVEDWVKGGAQNSAA